MSRVTVVGGGVIGACCAYYLAKAGCRITVLDRGKFGAGCSHANCGYVCPSHVLPLAVPGAVWDTVRMLLRRNSPLKVKPSVVLRDPGWFLRFVRKCNTRDMTTAAGGIRALLDSSRTLFDELIRSEALDCEWTTRGLLFVFQTAAAMEHYAEIDRMLREQFQTAAEPFDSKQLETLEPALKPGLGGGWLYRSDANLRPDRLMSELRRVLVGLGVEIRENSPVSRIVTEGRKVRAVATPSGDHDADHVVLATGAWTPEFAKAVGCRVPVQPGKGYSVTFPATATDPTYPMIFEDHRVAVTPFRSGFRVGSTMEFGGYDATLNRNRLRLLTDGASHYLRNPPTGEPTEEWWGWRPMTPDGLPLLGRAPAADNLWVAAGHNMLGLSMAPATGRLIAELVTGEKPHVDPAAYSLGRV